MSFPSSFAKSVLGLYLRKNCTAMNCQLSSIAWDVVGPPLTVARTRCAGLPKSVSGLSNWNSGQQRRLSLGRKALHSSNRRSPANPLLGQIRPQPPCIVTGAPVGGYSPLLTRRFLGNLAARNLGTNFVSRSGATLLFLATPTRLNGTVAAASQPTNAADRPTTSSAEEEDLKKKLDDLVKSTPVVLFMKGSPKAPMCGFSARAVGILNSLDVDEYTFVNILQYPDVRALAKKHFSWPTYPLLIVGGEVVGGVDIMDELNKTGELGEMIRQAVKGSECAAVQPAGGHSKP
ncbi:glutaredoxin-related protein [Toxoplasma gondii TgCatPRC2]|uniref:Glutaredoxin-related protein n=3 Tax=Toxoplasma gondii TaxID=5811 RepID=A0A151HN77_TOXGO|nr:glutaredoxin-related protein [Toxoplasma gondii ME49]EPT28261.1 glutaredoxin-related protein [Toxoplasma gondii ME49]KYF47138.1 glutaredoxin-related protein [Toxoplasma gondii ARI]KYK70849.1 glutaredoxin-related protein [Toxoplasma gondii TgCatPRC2]|eukprot:XP_018636552.1 glutaredoxin-related protein [Toxoplasma gondii ME49]